MNGEQITYKKQTNPESGEIDQHLKSENIPELLLPAGNLTKLKTAYLYGADAAYCGVPRYSLRARENEFRLENLKEAVELARFYNKKIYFTVNSIPRNSKIKSFRRYLDAMAELKPDAFIMADPGLIMMVRERHPDIAVHISVQTNTMNYATVRFWQSIGASRVILSREVTIEEAAEIKQQVPDMELEVFVHGSICIAHSGRCLMSNYFKKRDANQGACNNACRDEFKVFVTNPRQNDEPMELIEDSAGTYLMNSKDLRAIQHLGEIAAAGIDSIKVEGRTRNDFYVAIVARTYRQALEDIRNGKPFNPALLAELDKLSSRGYFSGFLARNLNDPAENNVEANNSVRPNTEETGAEEIGENYLTGDSRVSSAVYAGHVQSYDAETGLAYFEIKSKLKVGDEVEVFLPGQFETKHLKIEILLHKGHEIDVISGGMGEVATRSPFPLPAESYFCLPLQKAAQK